MNRLRSDNVEHDGVRAVPPTVGTPVSTPVQPATSLEYVVNVRNIT
jgi:hypothetical protein